MELPGGRLATTPARSGRPGLVDPIEVPTRFQLIIDGPGDGAWNMAVDEALMSAARSGVATLRFYTWDPACLSLGRNQSTPARIQGRSRAELRAGREVVRRPTGGRSVYHSRELTYSISVPDRLWGGPRHLYRRVNRALRQGLIWLGAALDPDPIAGAAERGSPMARVSGPAGSLGRRPRSMDAGRGSLGSRACFEEPAPGEVTAGGRKLVGSAQWRHRGTLLQHGSVLLVNEQGKGDLRSVAVEEPEKAAVGLAELLREPPEPGELAAALTEAFGEEFGRRPKRARLAPALEMDARRLAEDRYRTQEWTWRR